MYLPSIWACATSEYGWFASSVERCVYVATRSTPSRILGLLFCDRRRPDRFGNLGSLIGAATKDDGEALNGVVPLFVLTRHREIDELGGEDVFTR